MKVDYPFAFRLSILFILLDVILTWFILKFGIGTELNPFAVYAINTVGYGYVAFVKTAISVFVASIVFSKGTLGQQKFLFSALGIIVLWNIGTILFNIL